MKQPNLENLESYYTICLDSKITQLFSSTMLGIDYWKKHKHQTCYQCRNKGHLANVCNEICPHCKNYHPGLPICIWNMENLFEKIYKILRRKECKRVSDRYMKIVAAEQRINNELAENSAQEIKEKNNILKYEKLYIQNRDKLEFHGGNIYAFQKIVKIEDKKYEEKYHNYFLANYQTNTSTIYRIYSWIKNKYFGKNKISITDRIQYISNADAVNNMGENSADEDKIDPVFIATGKHEVKNNNSNADPTVTIETESRIFKYTVVDKKTRKRNVIQCIVPNRSEWLKKIKKEALEKIKQQKNKIEATSRFAFDKVYSKIKDIKDLTRTIEGLKDKRQNLYNQNEELMEKIERKKGNLNGLKGRMNHINNEKNNILNAARAKGEVIKGKAYNTWRYWFGKRTGYNPADYGDDYEYNEYDDYDDY